MCECMTRKRAAYACRKNRWTPSTLSWWLFAHFLTQKRAASVGLRHACMHERFHGSVVTSWLQTGFNPRSGLFSLSSLTIRAGHATFFTAYPNHQDRVVRWNNYQPFQSPHPHLLYPRTAKGQSRRNCSLATLQVPLCRGDAVKMPSSTVATTRHLSPEVI